jgi:enamine deaminase RidA (YjgF/YER057c/UK114 family)
MNRTAINPTSWSQQFGYNQGELIEGHQRTLYCAGQVSIDSDGKPQHEGDIRAQIELALDNLEAVLRGADMSLTNVVRLTIYTTDLDGMFANFDAIIGRLDAANAKPPQTLLGVARLGLPTLLVEIEATAAA